MAVGGAEALVPELALGHAVVVAGAVRDEGTSFHYAPASRAIDADGPGVQAAQEALTRAELPFTIGRTWTTDAFYQETRRRVQRRMDEGCVTVEMEASALIAVARYRKVRYAHLLYAGDSLAATDWDHRGWATAETIREGMFNVAADACLSLDAAGKCAVGLVKHPRRPVVVEADRREGFGAAHIDRAHEHARPEIDQS